MRLPAIVIGCVFYLSSVGQNVAFFREDLVFSIDSVYLTINGKYYFRNNTEQKVSIPIIYPFPRIHMLKAVEKISVIDLEKPGLTFKVNLEDTLATFQVEIAAKSEKAISISYRQQHKGNIARYILTTTSRWKKPFEEANYDLIVPSYFRIVSFPFEPDSFSTFGDEKIYHWKKKDFMPDKDFDIEFRRNIK